ncbi:MULTISPECIES: glutathione S-transferase family protein [Burkholderiaceae]|uniref:glutathione transferase n=1 Tax=Caballeronia sordidicola TaxID=196367 RepID=A0A242N1K7_CABSO|nr:MULTISPECIES: glutathione S-transferase [Burkholderiaceae]AME25417.1 glutathione S-transferase [Burkholderia sp. PAMC 26561]OTP77026.1 Glutathione S-transferase [Caballeronia sordidicola]
MIEVHHLNESRSRRITWLLEELGLDYTVHVYKRDPKTRLAPPELEKIHPLGKAPVIRDGDEVIFESGAIIEYLIRKHGNGRLAPTQDTHAFNQYLQFLHYAEGSAMLPLMLKLYTGGLGEGAAPLQPRIESEMKRHLGFLDKSLEGHDFFVGNELTGADIQLSFAVQMAVKFCGDDAYPNLTAFVKRIEALPAYRRAIEKSGE